MDTTTFVVLGEGLAAGMANFGLQEAVQDQSFPAQIARQMKTAFPQPLMESPGIGDILGHPSLPKGLPSLPQTRVRIFPARPNPNDEAPTLFVMNLSVPGLKLPESISRRPTQPLIHRDPKQRAINLILGFPALILRRDVPLWSQFEYAKAMAPTMALIELGYYDVLEPAIQGDLSLLPDPAAFRSTYRELLQGLRAQYAEVIATTIPDPLDTACFMDAAAAAALFRMTPEFLRSSYGLQPDDLITRNGLTAINSRVLRKTAEALPPGSVLPGSAARQIRERVRALNSEITNLAAETGAVVFDLNAFFSRVRSAGVRAGNRTLTGGYLGGFYSLDGYYPGTTGHALIANEILGFLNRTYGQSFPMVEVAPVMSTDPVLQSSRAADDAVYSDRQEAAP